MWVGFNEHMTTIARARNSVQTNSIDRKKQNTAPTVEAFSIFPPRHILGIYTYVDYQWIDVDTDYNC